MKLNMLNRFNILDNQDVAVLTKLNELAERHGLKPYDFLANLKPADESYTLDFEIPASGNNLREERYEKMLNGLGIGNNDKASVTGEMSYIIDAIDNALKIAPRRRRF
jgi:hypothetical protein